MAFRNNNPLMFGASGKQDTHLLHASEMEAHYRPILHILPNILKEDQKCLGILNPLSGLRVLVNQKRDLCVGMSTKS